MLKCPKYSCPRICSVDDTKVDIDWICTRSKLILPPETNEHCTKTRKQNTPHKDETTKYTIQRKKIKTNKYVKITLINYNEKEQII
jgi:hypothetical protein